MQIIYLTSSVSMVDTGPMMISALIESEYSLLSLLKLPENVLVYQLQKSSMIALLMHSKV